MIHVAVIGDVEAAFEAARKGFVVLGVEQNLEESVEKAHGIFIYIGKADSKLRIFAGDDVEAVKIAVASSDIAIINDSPFYELARAIARKLAKPYVDCKEEEVSGAKAVEKAVEKLVRYNLFGKKE